MSNIKNWIFAIIFATSAGGALLVVATPQPAAAACATQRLLTFPAWYKGLVNDNCEIEQPSGKDGKPSIQTFIWTIALNIIELILQLVGYIAVGFIIYGGYQYMISAGSSDGMVKARKTITNAVVGLVISIFSVAIVVLVSGVI